jgi:hypothetical protein
MTGGADETKGTGRRVGQLTSACVRSCTSTPSSSQAALRGSAEGTKDPPSRFSNLICGWEWIQRVGSCKGDWVGKGNGLTMPRWRMAASTERSCQDSWSVKPRASSARTVRAAGREVDKQSRDSTYTACKTSDPLR